MPAPKTVINVAVTKTLQSEVTPEYGGNLVRMEVTDSENIDPKIFVYQRDVNSEFSPEDLSIFWAIASVPELDTFPADAGSQDEPFFRLNYVEATFDSPAELETFVAKYMSEILKLQRANDIMLDPANAEVINYEVTEGAVAIVEGESSSSSSG